MMQGKPVLRGTRIPVELVLRKLGGGASEGNLFGKRIRGLTREDIHVTMRYAADTLAGMIPARGRCHNLL